MDTEIDAANLREGDAVYVHGRSIFIGGEVVSIEDVPEMSGDELNGLHEDLMDLVVSTQCGGCVYNMLTVVTGEIVRRD